MDENCIFCKINQGIIKSEKLFENDEFFVIKDISPIAPTHLLLISKKHLPDFSHFNSNDFANFGKYFETLQGQLHKLNLDGGYRIIINQGNFAGQAVPHFHAHLLSGKELDWKPL